MLIGSRRIRTHELSDQPGSLISRLQKANLYAHHQARVTLHGVGVTTLFPATHRATPLIYFCPVVHAEIAKQTIREAYPLGPQRSGGRPLTVLSRQAADVILRDLTGRRGFVTIDALCIRYGNVTKLADLRIVDTVWTDNHRVRVSGTDSFREFCGQTV